MQNWSNNFLLTQKKIGRYLKMRHNMLRKKEEAGNSCNSTHTHNKSRPLIIAAHVHYGLESSLGRADWNPKKNKSRASATIAGITVLCTVYCILKSTSLHPSAVQNLALQCGASLICNCLFVCILQGNERKFCDDFFSHKDSSSAWVNPVISRIPTLDKTLFNWQSAI